MAMSTLNKISMPLAFAMLAAAAAACSGTGPAKEAGGQADKPAATKEPVDIIFYSPLAPRTVEQFMKERGDDIQAKFPQYRIQFIPYAKGTETADLIAAGQTVDIIMSTTTTINELVKYGLQYDMTELIKKHKYDLNRLEPSLVRFMKEYSEGGMYGLPVSVSTFNLVYNKSVFDKFGVPYPKEGMTWDEVYELAKKLTRTEGGLQYYGLTMSVPHMLNINQLSAPYYDLKTNKVLLEEDKFKAVVGNYARFYQLAGDKAGDMITQWQNVFVKDQTAAMMVYYASFTLETKFDFDWDVISMPYFKEAMGVAPQYTPSYMEIAANSKHKDEAFEVLTYLTSDEYQMKQSRQGIMTSLKNPDVKKAFAQGSDILKGKNIKAYAPDQAALITPKDQLSGIAGSKATSFFKNIVTGQSDINTALRDAAEAARKEIETARVK
ncbi:hypothetical protein PAESOLCIP111_03377 [Paenibacillus solanacearum]|uniref:Extracellular solute-binding protein n=1 Tax=Paenibacillus solanacearum TaxID=2048548 RepID=A0A916NXS2_9BACL|nr:extracellular solute-binding protein [Paenibacillus solanacearum]CAG7632414.1 hypothetical protein PAESOLCIP111_03377 [Paenibacillus solanacearum]